MVKPSTFSLTLAQALAMLGVLATPLALTSAFAEAPEECPQTLTLHETLEGPTPAGWVARTDASPHVLVGVSFFDGDPAQEMSLAPSQDRSLPSSSKGPGKGASKGRNREALWRFGSCTEPVWLVCRYLDTSTILAKPLGSPYKECRVTYGPGGVVQAVGCK